ncbi:hypothetical protein M413DRAFT_25396 [Hebeloma cylindrosporum]|uniref:Uncharacterized protein n=1 Tax=Hebeloma cylindrosporum TaxID=76867 RepID=A0A0C3CMK8_HEBCY|nr:hypothetical protein M413DRAFT_25396 [Hebeloma cylindrosporum h7]
MSQQPTDVFHSSDTIPEESGEQQFSTPIHSAPQEHRSSPLTPLATYSTNRNIGISGQNPFPSTSLQRSPGPFDEQGNSTFIAFDLFLVPIGDPIIKPLQDPFCYSDTTVNFPSCKSALAYEGTSGEIGDIVLRRNRALRLGTEYTRREIPFRPDLPQHLSRSEERGTFKFHLDLLDDLLTNVVKYTDTYRVGYGLEKETYSHISQELQKLRNQVWDNLITTGEGIPLLPMWGKDGNINLLWNANDFEILGALYRAEVERFMIQISQITLQNVTKDKGKEGIEGTFQ